MAVGVAELPSSLFRSASSLPFGLVFQPTRWVAPTHPTATSLDVCSMVRADLEAARRRHEVPGPEFVFDVLAQPWNNAPASGSTRAGADGVDRGQLQQHHVVGHLEIVSELHSTVFGNECLSFRHSVRASGSTSSMATVTLVCDCLRRSAKATGVPSTAVYCVTCTPPRKLSRLCR